MRRFSPLNPLLVLLLLCAVGLASSAPADAAPNRRLKRKLLHRVENCLSDKAFVYGVDFDRWPGLLEEHLPTVDASSSDAELATAVNRVLASFEVSHLSLVTPAGLAARESGLSIGAGIKVVATPDGQLVTTVAADSPAASVGLRRGDLIVRVDGTVVDGERRYPELIDYRLFGRPGEVRMVDWIRDDVEFSAEIGFARHPSADPPALEWRPGGVAWLAVSSFKASAYDRDLVAQFFEEISARAVGLVIDVRGNSGGRFNNVMHLASFLVVQGKTGAIITRRRDFKRRKDALESRDLSSDEQIRALGDPFEIKGNAERRVFEGPLIVLIDGTSGSGGDLFPAMMQDLRQATLIGDTTFGALLAGEWCKLPGGFKLLYPSKEILRPSGERVEGVGVSPDIDLGPWETLDDERVEAVAIRALASSD